LLIPWELDKAALRSRRQRRSALPNDIRAVLADADLAAERTAARLRLCALLLIEVMLVARNLPREVRPPSACTSRRAV
jgi:hypothetical protein